MFPEGRPLVCSKKATRRKCVPPDPTAQQSILEPKRARPPDQAGPIEMRSWSRTGPVFLLCQTQGEPANALGARGLSTESLHQAPERSARSPKALADENTVTPSNASCSTGRVRRVFARRTCQAPLVKHDCPVIVIIEVQYSEVRLDRFREAHGNGQGS